MVGVGLPRLSAVFHVVDQDGNKLYDGQVIDRIEQVKCSAESPVAARCQEQSNNQLLLLNWMLMNRCRVDSCFSPWERDR